MKGKMFYNYRTDELISDEMPGLSVFYKDEDGDVFHTYSTYGARARHPGWRLQFSRSSAERPRRKSRFHDGLGPAARRILSGVQRKERNDESRYSL